MRSIHQIEQELRMLADQHPANFRSGTYQLFFYLQESVSLEIGGLGNFDFAEGYYVYTGRHKKFLVKRVLRHLSGKKKNWWHVDYISSHSRFQIVAILLYPQNDRECRIHRSFQKHTKASEPVVGFGNGDCQKGCNSHLLYLQDLSKKTIENWIMAFPQSTQVCKVGSL
jgi:Uri superfamily endonuclease